MPSAVVQVEGAETKQAAPAPTSALPRTGSALSRPQKAAWGVVAKAAGTTPVVPLPPATVADAEEVTNKSEASDTGDGRVSRVGSEDAELKHKINTNSILKFLKPGAGPAGTLPLSFRQSMT